MFVQHPRLKFNKAKHFLRKTKGLLLLMAAHDNCTHFEHQDAASCVGENRNPDRGDGLSIVVGVGALPIPGTSFAPWLIFAQPQDSWRAVTRVRSLLSSGALYLLRYLFDCCRGNNRCWPHLPTVARDLNYHEDHVGRLARELVATGLLKITHRGPRGNLYELLWHDEYAHALHRPVREIGKKSDISRRVQSPTPDVGLDHGLSLYEDTVVNKKKTKLASESDSKEHCHRPAEIPPEELGLLQSGLSELQRQNQEMVQVHQAPTIQTIVNIFRAAKARDPSVSVYEVVDFIRERVVHLRQHWVNWGGVVHMVQNDFARPCSSASDFPAPTSLKPPLQGLDPPKTVHQEDLCQAQKILKQLSETQLGDRGGR
jgi:hypothetical protein